MRNKINISKIKTLACVFVYVAGLMFLVYQLIQNPIIKNKFAYFNRFFLVYKYEITAKKFPPSSVQAKRLNAIADSLRHNKTEYQFTTGQLPPMAGK